MSEDGWKVGIDWGGFDSSVIHSGPDGICFRCKGPCKVIRKES